jgi:hypothetical protein
VVTEELAQGDTRQILHHEVREVRILSLVENADDVRIGEARGAACFLHEPVAEVAVVGEVPVHDLDRYAPLETAVGSEVDRRHTAPGDARAHVITVVNETSDNRVGLLAGRHERKSMEPCTVSAGKTPCAPLIRVNS